MSDGIKAGRAWMELSLKDKLSTGLKGAKKRLDSFARGVGAVGLAISGAADGVLGGLGYAATKFADFGSAIFDASSKTGVGAEFLSGLSYGADQAGASFESVEAGMKGIAKFTGNVAAGSKSAAKTLKDLGISSKEFLAATPEDRMRMIADGLAKIEDQSLRNAVAMQALGKGGDALLPMLQGGSKGLDEMVARARALGVVLSDEQAKKADDLGDAWGDLQSVWKGIVLQTGAALAETLTDILLKVVDLGMTIVEFVQNNQRMIMIIAGVAAAVSAIGTAMLLIAGAAAIAGMAITGLFAIGSAIAAVWGALVAAVSFLLSPLGLIVVAVAAVAAAVAYGLYYFIRYTEAGKAGFSSLVTMLGILWQTATTTFKGIWDAIAAGNWQLAGEILMLGLTVAWRQGIVIFKTVWSEFKQWILNLFAGIVSGVTNQFAGMLTAIIDKVESVRKFLHLPELPGVASARGAVEALKGAGGAAAAGIRDYGRAGREKSVADAVKRYAEAQQKLQQAVAKAAEQRSAIAAGKVPSARNYTPGGITPPDTKFGSLATFNARIAGMLGRSGMSSEERTAKATEEIADDIAVVRQRVEGGGVVIV